MNDNAPDAIVIERKIWIDVTTLAHWNRPAVGIVRVEQQLCRWLLEQNKADVGFCFYDRVRQLFFELDRDSVVGHLERIAASAWHNAPSGSGVVMNFEQRLRKRLLNSLERVPPRLRSVALRTLLWAKPGALRIIGHARRYRSLIRERRSVVAKPREQRRQLEFANGDTYVSLGLDWDYKDMAHLYRLKKERSLRFVFCCYDIIPILFPHLCVGDVSRQFAHYFADLAWAADLVLCISESSRRDLEKLLDKLHVPAPEMAVMHLGSAVLSREEKEAAPSEAVARVLERPYILFVSTIERRKNHEVLYRAYTRLAEESLELPDLVFVGMAGWGIDELLSDIRLDPRVQGRIRVLNHVSDQDLNRLYQHAYFTVFPSLYEGWGLPVAESLAHGKFCLCSNTSSLPEVGGDWVEYLDPWDVPAWVDRLRHYIAHPEEVAKRNAQIVAGYRPCLWRETSADIYTHALRISRRPT